VATVRLQWCTFSEMKVLTSENYSAITNSNCVTVKWGGKQLEVKDQAVGGRTRFGRAMRRASLSDGEVRKSLHTVE